MFQMQRAKSTALGAFGMLAALWVSAAGPAVAAEPALTLGRTDNLHSKILDEDRELMVYLPTGYESSEARYPVLYLLDAGTRFLHTSGTVESLARTGHIPEMIVVGVRNTNRTRDLTPAVTNVDAESVEDFRAQAVLNGGGADRFLDFLTDELVPYVESTYRTVPFRVLVGHSFGGLFAVHALTTKPGFFQATLAISPSLWWDDGEPVERTRKLFESRPDLTHRLYATLADEAGDMGEQFRNFQAVLRYLAPEGLDWKAQLLDGEDHGSIPVVSVYQGLRFFFPKWQVPPFAREEGLRAIDAHYAALSESYGYELSTPEATINNLGYRFLGEDVERAIEIFRANTERFPGSANVYDSLGEALEAANQLEESLANYRKAAQMAEAQEHPNLTVYRTNAERVSGLLESGSGE